MYNGSSNKKLDFSVNCKKCREKRDFQSNASLFSSKTNNFIDIIEHTLENLSRDGDPRNGLSILAWWQCSFDRVSTNLQLKLRKVDGGWREYGR